MCLQKYKNRLKMKNHLPFDQHFKSQLEDVESLVPDHMFENIMAERKRRRGFALFFQNNGFKYGLAACALLAATGLLFLKSNRKSVQQPVTSASATVQQPVASASATVQQPVASASATVQQPVASVSATVQQPVASVSATVQQPVASASATVLASASVIVPNRVLETPSSNSSGTQNRTSYKSKTLISNGLDNVSPTQTTHTEVEATVLKPTDGVVLRGGQRASPSENIINLTQKQQDVPVNALENQAVEQSNQVENQHTESIDEPKAKSLIAQLPTKKVHLIQGQVKASDVKSITRMMGPEINCPNFNLRKPSRWYIDIWGSPDYALRKLYNNQGENTSYANARDSVERSWYAFSAGARVSVVLESGVAVRAGLNYLQNNEVFDYKKPGEVRTITITETVKQPNGTTITSTRTENQYGTYQLKKYNRYRSIDLPIQLGYEFGRMPWSYSVNGGINFNLTSWRKAEILNPALLPFDASKKDANVFKSNVGASLYASFAAYYDWKDYTQLFVEPYIRHFLSPITTKDYLLEQRYTDLGLKLGIRWRL
jgi:hypothetical protein